MELQILKVDRDYRIVLPQSFVQHASWITGDQALTGWLLVGIAGRCRLLSPAELDTDQDLQSLRTRIVADRNTQNSSALEFHEERLVVLPLRLVAVQITPPGPVWRLKLPKPIAVILQIRPGESEVAALFVQDHIELWTIETLRSSMITPLTQII
jgi:hypothetical protein